MQTGLWDVVMCSSIPHEAVLKKGVVLLLNGDIVYLQSKTIASIAVYF